jgi:hypothetical protein
MDVVGLVAVLAALLLGVGYGLWHKRNDGRLRPVSAATDRTATGTPGTALGSGAAGAPRATGTAAEAGAVVTPDIEEMPADIAEPAHDRIDPGLLSALGVAPARATLLQFSSAFCAPCRAVRRVSAEVATLIPGVQHVDVDAESHLDAVRALSVWRTPTLFVLDADGRVAKRATGVPSKAQLIAALAGVLAADSPAPEQR